MKPLEGVEKQSHERRTLNVRCSLFDVRKIIRGLNVSPDRSADLRFAWAKPGVKNHPFLTLNGGCAAYRLAIVYIYISSSVEQTDPYKKRRARGKSHGTGKIRNHRWGGQQMSKSKVTVYTARNVRTMDPGRPEVQAVAVLDGKVLSSGSRTSRLEWSSWFD
jgi:hypothetical protein